jgi:CubicO group peptidase (beta-lactamase class C family)
MSASLQQTDGNQCRYSSAVASSDRTFAVTYSNRLSAASIAIARVLRDGKFIVRVATQTQMHGSVSAGFEQVREEFECNLAERGEVGAAVCVSLGGEVVVDLYGGLADPDTATPWNQDTAVCVMSAGKGAVALCANMLLDRGLLDLDEPVARRWPGFGRNGKSEITVGMLLNHTAGLPHVRAALPQNALCDWDFMVAVLEAEAPWWSPGSKQSYHGLTFGWLVGELIRRADGRTVGEFLAEEVAGPLGLDVRIGVPAGEQQRIAPLIPPVVPDEGPAPGSLLHRALTNPDSPAGQLLLNNGGWMQNFNATRYHAAQIPAANAVATARGLACLYRPLANGGSQNGVRLLSEQWCARLPIPTSSSQADATLGCRLAFTLGFHTSVGNRDNPAVAGMDAILGAGAFGHAGNGGSLGFADPQAGLSFGYVMNRMSPNNLLDDRCQSLVDATYRALGYSGHTSVCWTR